MPRGWKNSAPAPKTSTTSSKKRWSKNSGRSAGNCIPAAAATSWSPPISAYSSSMQPQKFSAAACPMGSGALAGNSFAIDRNAIARQLGFSRITANSLDAVSDRDFALDYLFALCGIATHLSRLAEDFVIFASQEFSYVILPDEYSTGSSLMPQKKNPDAWELIRGKTGRITGALLGLLTTLKGLPTSYQRDLQEDKEALFAAHDQVMDMIAVATGAVASTRFNAERLRTATSNPALLATEAADYLVH